MSSLHLIFRNLLYYRKPYLAILAGVVISTAVLCGALAVGDSVKYSLLHLTDLRLGKTRFALQGNNRFFRQQLAEELENKLEITAAPLLVTEGIAINPDREVRINRVNVLAVGSRFIRLWDQNSNPPAADEAILSKNTAERLHLSAGDEILIRVNKPALAPQNAPFVSEKEPSVSIRLKVSAIAEDEKMGRYSLKSNQAAPYNIFVSLPALQAKFRLSKLVNLILISGDTQKITREKLETCLQLSWKPADAGLSILPRGKPGTYEVTSGRIFLDSLTISALRSTFLSGQGYLSYLANSLSLKGKATPYSFVSATETPIDGRPVSGKEIVISSWLAADLQARAGDSLCLRYFIMGSMRALKEDSARFIIRKILPVTDPVFDRSLMPDFPGMSDAGNCRDWETGAPIDLGKIRDKDEQYWKLYRGTPKALISLGTGQRLWNNPFGQLTSFRFICDAASLPGLETSLMKRLSPAANGLIFKAVYEEGSRAAVNSTDFKGLFLSLSFFIIAAGLLLTALLFAMHANSRTAETGLLSAVGFSRRRIIGILASEAVLVAFTGGLLGLLAGIGYNRLILYGLSTVWQAAVGSSILQLHIRTSTLILGALLGMITSLLVLLLVLLRNLRKSPAFLVKGYTIPGLLISRRKVRTTAFASLFFILAATGLLTYLLITSQINNPDLFLTAGASMLIGGIAAFRYFLLKGKDRYGETIPSYFQLVLRNAGLKPTRTISAIALLATGCFTILITAANRRTFSESLQDNHSGTGGFLLWTETTLPIRVNPNSAEGKTKLGIDNETLPDSVQFYQMLHLDGDDASCLNLNQVRQPLILGINVKDLDRYKAFRFVSLIPSVRPDSPWIYLDGLLAPGIIPAFADQSVIIWGLQKQIGDTLLYRDESGKPLRLVLSGGLDNSVFQGKLLVSDSLFHLFYPSVNGSNLMLVRGQVKKQKEIANSLENLFRDYGLMATPAQERLAAFNAVENTYLSVFMILGALGLLIGTAGLGIVLWRNTTERRSQMALLLALGYQRSSVLLILLGEYLFILLAGLFLGLISALAGILPSLLSPAFQVPGRFILSILLLILLNGFLWIWFPARAIMRRKLVPSLRQE